MGKANRYRESIRRRVTIHGVEFVLRQPNVTKAMLDAEARGGTSPGLLSALDDATKNERQRLAREDQEVFLKIVLVECCESPRLVLTPDEVLDDDTLCIDELGPIDLIKIGELALEMANVTRDEFRRIAPFREPADDLTPRETLGDAPERAS